LIYIKHSKEDEGIQGISDTVYEGNNQISFTLRLINLGFANFSELIGS